MSTHRTPNPAPDAGLPLVGIPDGAGAAPAVGSMAESAAGVALLPERAGPYRDLCAHCGSISTHSGDHYGLCDECIAEARAEFGDQCALFAPWVRRWYRGKESA